LLNIRPKISSIQTPDAMSANEGFQNQTLRPILKFQNELLLELFRNQIKTHKNSFYKLSLEKKLLYIDNTLQKDTKFKNTLKGLIIGLFTVEEYLFYTQDVSAHNKRIMSMVLERLKSQIQLLEDPVLIN